MTRHWMNRLAMLAAALFVLASAQAGRAETKLAPPELIGSQPAIFHDVSLDPNCDAATCTSPVPGCAESGCVDSGCAGSECAGPRSSGYYCGCCCKPKLLGLFMPSDCRFDRFISPMTNPVYFEDPRNLTEARVLFVNHRIPGNVLGGGNVQIAALQLRAALTERLSLIATKDGYIFAGGGDAPDINGWANVAMGLKYNVFADAEMQRLISVGARIEMPFGSYHALQGNSKTSNFDLFLTGGTQLGELSHLISASGFRLPADHNQQNTQFYWSTHLDRQLRNRPIYGLVECNWYHWMSNVAGGPPVGGLDFYNLGSSGVAGSNIVTGAVGLKYKPKPGLEIGVCYEKPLTNRKDLMQDRITADLILRY